MDRKNVSKKLVDEIEKRTGINLFNCYQCGKCSAGCVFSNYMDVPPHKLNRLIQLGLDDKALNSNTMWSCGACVTCSARCPREIDVLKVINTVKEIALERKVHPRDKKIRPVRIFDEVFLDNVIRNDRLNELMIGVYFNLKSGKFFKDITLFPKLVKKGKFAGDEKAGTKKVAKAINKLKA